MENRQYETIHFNLNGRDVERTVDVRGLPNRPAPEQLPDDQREKGL